MLKWHGPEAHRRFRPFYFRGCGLTAECLLARENVRVRFPATAPLITGLAPAGATGPPNPSVLGAAPRRPANESWGRGRQAMHLLCKQANMGALPIDSTISGSVAQSAEQPVVCGKAEGASPFGSANFTHLTAGPPTRVSGPVFLGSGVLLPVRSHQRVAWRQRTRFGTGISRRAQAPGAIPAALTLFSLPPWCHVQGLRLLSGTMPVQTPAGGAIARWCQSSPAERD